MVTCHLPSRIPAMWSSLSGGEIPVVDKALLLLVSLHPHRRLITARLKRPLQPHLQESVDIVHSSFSTCCSLVTCDRPARMVQDAAAHLAQRASCRSAHSPLHPVLPSSIIMSVQKDLLEPSAEPSPAVPWSAVIGDRKRSKSPYRV
jgi:hypothetical protein